MRRLHARAAHVLSIALLSLGFATSAQAVALFQNDAGSGGDAGDTIDQATPVTAGYHSAQLSTAGDLFDWYQLPLTKGDKLRVHLSDYGQLGLRTVVMKLLSPAGQAIELEPEGVLLAGNAYNGKIAEVVVHETGTWSLFKIINHPGFRIYNSHQRTILNVSLHHHNASYEINSSIPLLDLKLERLSHFRLPHQL